ncbi:hypothetical protein [Streptomyces noursei]|uniref:hypothetical protein n=1 Tax=Streptomyces noursei TaxID=1971 RepID=UPI00196516EA|nr:hypothetical protein [Streptomyces noursei]QRX90879.1 hypothetical protein JNO44_08585 [Streptomyces noursei]QRX93368.1 hypothetical protein JNO44_23125 [Streptomyces noursei]
MAAVPLDLLDRIRALERQVRELSGRAQTRPALNRITHGTVVIGEGGSLDVRAPGGAQVLGVGQFATGRYGVSMAREDGTGVALEVGGNDTTAAQMVRLFARGGYPSPIVMDDGYADGYLGRPWVPIPLAPSATVTASDWTTTHAGTIWTQHAVLAAQWSIYAPAGTTAEARLMLNRGGNLTQLGDTLTAAGKEVFTSQRITPSAHGLSRGDTAALLIQARRTAGAGTAVAWCQGMWGSNTANASEANH